jgi:hypothetical protein
LEVPSTSVKEPAFRVPVATQQSGPSASDQDLIPGRVDASALNAAIEHHRSESQRLAKAATQHRNELRELLRRRDQHIAQLQASGWQLTHIASLYKVTKARIAQITKAFRTAGEHLALPGGDAR